VTTKLGFPLQDDPAALAAFGGWDESIYRDFLALEAREMQQSEFDAKYLSIQCILVLDVTGFTVAAMHGGSLDSFQRILDIQKICFPVFQDAKASLVRAFADDVTALFEDPHAALNAALEIHRRIRRFNEFAGKHAHPPECCIGIGYGPVYEIGPNRAMGDEMNRTSVLGEDTARGNETLITAGAHAVLADRSDVGFEPQGTDDLAFPYYRVTMDS
jgi:class 3 adenylate cyclase